MGITSIYEGESSKSAIARGRKHLEELGSAVRTNEMVIDNSIHHELLSKSKFVMRVIRTFHSPLDRQIEESICMKDSE